MAHRLSEIDEQLTQAICAECGPVEIRKKVRSRGNVGFIWECREKRRAERRTNEEERARGRIRGPRKQSRTIRKHVGPLCVRCGFIPEDPCQLEVDHITPKWDGGTDDPSNLQTLCCNCHALKTKHDVARWRSLHGRVARPRPGTANSPREIESPEAAALVP